MENSKITKENFTRVNNDINGNPRYVIHFLDLLTDKEQNEIYKTNYSLTYIRLLMEKAVEKVRQLGGKKYRGKDFGGGIVFQSYNVEGLADEINNLLNR